MNVGIVGYGNLGKAVEREIVASGEFRLIRIFSRRDGKNLSSPFENEFEKLDNLENFVNKIDLLFLCGGSFDDIEKIGPRAIEHFCTVDAFDTHSKLLKYKQTLDKIAKNSNKVALTAFGWDPGLLSLIRTTMAGIAGVEHVSTFWGKGVSQGHSDTLRRIASVENAIQFTIPNKNEIKRAINQPNYAPKLDNMHKRVCFVALKNGQKSANFLQKTAKKQCFLLQKTPKNQQLLLKKTAKKQRFLLKKTAKNQRFLLKKQQKIRKFIKEIPNYFAGQKTIVHFVSNEEVANMQKDMSHHGLVVSNFMLPNCYKNLMKFEIDMQDNPALTARIMLVGAKVVFQLFAEKKFGGYSILDIPPKYFLSQNETLL